VHVNPEPLPDARLVAWGSSFAAEIGLTEKHMCGDLMRLLSGDVSGLAVDPWATPYAVSVFGHAIVAPDPFGTGKGYGDGRAVTLGEFGAPGSSGGDRSTQTYELQLKGSGTTPFSRGADGRAVLRSSVREFVTQEAMHALGVRTTRGLSLIGSSSLSVHRPWYPSRTAGRPQQPSIMRAEQCAIACRAAPTFFRVGHFELYSRRFGREGHPDAPLQLQLLLMHAARREYPQLLAELAAHTHHESSSSGSGSSGGGDDGDSTDDPGGAAERGDMRALTPLLAVGFVRAVRARLIELVVGWIRVGYVQGNMNSDNCAVGKNDS